MEEENKRYDYVEDVEISKEMRTAFLDYSCLLLFHVHYQMFVMV